MVGGNEPSFEGKFFNRWSRHSQKGKTSMSEISTKSELVVDRMSMSYRANDGTEIHALKDIHSTMKGGDSPLSSDLRDAARPLF